MTRLLSFVSVFLVQSGLSAYPRNRATQSRTDKFVEIWRGSARPTPTGSGPPAPLFSTPERPAGFQWSRRVPATQPLSDERLNRWQLASARPIPTESDPLAPPAGSTSMSSVAAMRQGMGNKLWTHSKPPAAPAIVALKEELTRRRNEHAELRAKKKAMQTGSSESMATTAAITEELKAEEKKLWDILSAGEQSELLRESLKKELKKEIDAINETLQIFEKEKADLSSEIQERQTEIDESYKTIDTEGLLFAEYWTFLVVSVAKEEMVMAEHGEQKSILRANPDIVTVAVMREAIQRAGNICILRANLPEQAYGSWFLSHEQNIVPALVEQELSDGSVDSVRVYRNAIVLMQAFKEERAEFDGRADV